MPEKTILFRGWGWGGAIGECVRAAADSSRTLALHQRMNGWLNVRSRSLTVVRTREEWIKRKGGGGGGELEYEKKNRKNGGRVGFERKKTAIEGMGPGKKSRTELETRAALDPLGELVFDGGCGGGAGGGEAG